MDIRGRLEFIPLTLYAIFRNKRRSFAMISGIILGVTILTSIFIYNDVLQQNNFESVVENTAYEVRFDIETNETIAALNELNDLIGDDPRVEATSVIGREPDAFFANVEYSIDGTEENAVSSRVSSYPTFIDDAFADTAIGQKVFFEVEGVTDLQGGNKTLIPRALALELAVSVGDVIGVVNMTYTDFSDNRGGGFGGFDKNYKDTLRNVEVVGIYEKPAESSGVFGELFSQFDVYFSTDTLNNELPQIRKQIDKEQGYFLATKIDTSEFSVDSPETMVDEIESFINEISQLGEENGLEVTGYETISFLLIPYEITSVFVTIFDILLALPVVILSLYLLFFGLAMSLEERRREIAIKKVQGADTGQIYNELRNESIFMFIIGFVIGYFGGIIGAWLISSAFGFMKLDLGVTFNASFQNNLDAVLANFQDFFRYDSTALIWASAIVGGILTIQTIRQGRAFIESEVSESVQVYTESKEGFFKRNKLDMVLLGIGIINLVMNVAENQFDVDFNLNLFLDILINGLGPFLLWIGGAVFGSRVAKYVPQKLERVFLALPNMKDISRIIRSGLRRRGDTDRLAIIIVLTLSIATLAAAQGATDQFHRQRTAEWEIGADFNLNFKDSADYIENITTVDGVREAMALGISQNFRVLSVNLQVNGYDIEEEYQRLQNGDPVARWHTDSFRDMTVEEALKKLIDNPNGVYITRNTGFRLSKDIGDTINFKVTHTNFTTDNETLYTIDDVEILGYYDHIPGMEAGAAFGSNSMVNQISMLYNNQTRTSYDDLITNATRYLVSTQWGDDISLNKVNEMKSAFSQLDGFSASTSLQAEFDVLEKTGGAFGVSGLLSLNFLVAVFAAIISTFAFSAILMERRRREFAVLRAIGAKKRQIYKLALGENFLMVVSAVIWGSIIGLGITWQFNGVFEIFGVFLGSGPLNREVVFPLLTVSLIGTATTIGMLLATMISVRSAANQDLSTATRVI